MTGEEIPGLGPQFCAECRKTPYQTKIDDTLHPICHSHREWLHQQLQEHPERQVTWDSYGEKRRYAWMVQVHESRDGDGAPGDNDKKYVYSPPSRMMESGAVTRREAVALFGAREKFYGRGLREVPADDWSPNTDGM